MRIFWYSGDERSRQALAAELSRQGHLVRCAETPELPLEGEDLVLLQLPPDLDESVVLLREFRKRASAATPLVALGVWQLAAEIAPILDCGADDYIPYPCAPDVLALRLAVAAHLALKHSAAGEQKRLQERVALTSKTESLATLAGSLAHDFNNLLAAILGNTELALMDVAPQSPVRYCLDQIDKTSRRAAELARQMLTYAGRASNGSELSGVNLNELVQEMAELLRITIPKSCAIRYYFSRPLPLICGDPSQLRQVVMNLLINAGEAMGKDGGTILVRTGTVEEDGLSTGVTLEVRDTGSGMSAEIRARIFDPFFTTKKSGRGLGLAAVQGIVRSHQGKIEVESQPEKGSTFRILFPVYRGAEHATGQPPEIEVDWHGSGNVLLIDDDDAVREAAQRLLKKAGYTVLEARSGSEGIESVRRFGGIVHAAVLDINMPGMDGFAVCTEMRAMRPGIRVLIWSGLDPDGVRARLKELALDIEVIEKPSRMRDIAVALKRLLAPSETEQQSVA